MSRSRKRYPVHPVAVSKSERWDKKFWHSRFRHLVKQHIKTMLLDEDWDIPIFENVVAEVWCFNKDGKVWYEALAYKTKDKIFEKEIVQPRKWVPDEIFVVTKAQLHNWFGK